MYLRITLFYCRLHFIRKVMSVTTIDLKNTSSPVSKRLNDLLFLNSLQGKTLVHPRLLRRSVDNARQIFREAAYGISFVQMLES